MNDLGTQEQSQSEGLQIDFKRIAFRAIRFWYLVILSLVTCLFIAFLINRYALHVYQITASIIIREKNESSSAAQILYSNSLIDPYRNYLNEPYIIKSYPLMESVVKELNFEVAFFKKGNVKTSEIYDVPFKAKLLSTTRGGSMIFKIIDENTFSLQPVNNESNNREGFFKFNDSIDYSGSRFVLFKDSIRSISQYKNDRMLMVIHPSLSIATYYVNGIKIDWAEEGAGVLNLSISSSIPEKDIDFMNGLIGMYQKYNLDKKNQTAERTIKFIKEQLKDISDSLKIFENKLLKFKIQNSSYVASGGMSSSSRSDDEATRLYEKLTPLEAQKTELIIRARYFDYLLKYIGNGENLDQVVLPSSVGIDDPVLTGIVTKMVDIQNELKLYLGKGLSENPLIKTAQKKLSEIKGNLIEAINTFKSADKLKWDLLKDQIGVVEKQIAQLPLAQRQFITIQRNYSLLEGLYVFLMQKMSEAAISKASNVTDVTIVNPPMQGKSISPDTVRNYIVAVFTSLFIPFGIFLLFEMINQKVQSKEDIDKITSIPFLGGVGHNSSKNNLAVHNNPKSAVAESFRALRSNLNYFTGNQAKKVFMVSSSISGEGKTFSTVNLATVFAMSGRKTLIIGADMRKPKIFSDFNLTNDLGLSSYLSQMNSFEEVVQPTFIENIDLMSGGPVPPNPSELLLSSRFQDMIKLALEKYDYVIIDTPPLAIVTDAFVIAELADYVVFVIRQNYTQKEYVKDIHDFYSSGKLKNISIILNDIYKSGLGYGYGYGYGYGHGYYGKTKNGYGYYS